MDRRDAPAAHQDGSRVLSGTQGALKKKNNCFINTLIIQWQPEENNKYPAALDSFLHMCGEPISFLHDQAYFDPCSEPEKKDSFLHRYGKAVTKSIAIFIEQIYNSFLDVLPSEDKRELRETFNIKEDKPQVAKVSALMKNSRDCARITKNKRNEILPAEVRWVTE